MTVIRWLSCAAEDGRDCLLVLRKASELADRKWLDRGPLAIVADRIRVAAMRIGERFGHRESAHAPLTRPHTGPQENLELVRTRAAMRGCFADRPRGYLLAATDCNVICRNAELLCGFVERV